MSDKILIVEDDKITREGTMAYLEHMNYVVLAAENGKDALSLFLNHDFDLVLLDIMLPDTDGLTLLREFKQMKPNVAVVMLTALGDEKTQTQSFNDWADDYVVKPFSLVILEKRVAAILRRYKNSGQTIWQYHETSVDFTSYTASYKSEVVEMTTREIQVLEYLLTHENQVVTRSQILDALWEDRYPNDRVIDVYIKNLRKKLHLDCIVTVKGLGYKLETVL